jgi:hypothetical protein
MDNPVVSRLLLSSDSNVPFLFKEFGLLLFGAGDGGIESVQTFSNAVTIVVTPFFIRFNRFSWIFDFHILLPFPLQFYDFLQDPYLTDHDQQLTIVNI